MNDFPIGTRVIAEDFDVEGTVVEGDERTIFAQWGFDGRAHIRLGITLGEMIERCTLRGMPTEYEGEPVNPEDYVAVCDKETGITHWCEKSYVKPVTWAWPE